MLGSHWGLACGLPVFGSIEQVALAFEERGVACRGTIGQQRHLLDVRCGGPPVVGLGGESLDRESVAESVPVPRGDQCASFGGEDLGTVVCVSGCGRRTRRAGQRVARVWYWSRSSRLARIRHSTSRAFSAAYWLIDIWSYSNRLAAVRSARAAGRGFPPALLPNLRGLDRARTACRPARGDPGTVGGPLCFDRHQVTGVCVRRLLLDLNRTSTRATPVTPDLTSEPEMGLTLRLLPVLGGAGGLAAGDVVDPPATDFLGPLVVGLPEHDPALRPT